MTTPQQPAGASYVPLPGAMLAVPDPGQAIPVHRRDWDRIRRCVAAIAQPTRYAANMAWTAVGVSVAAVLAWLPWQAAYSQLPTKAHFHYAWVSPALVVTAIGAAILAVLGFVFAKQEAQKMESVVTGVVQDMDAIHPPAASSAQAPLVASQVPQSWWSRRLQVRG